MSYTQGAFNHGLSVARPLSITEASKLQSKLNKSLRIIYKIRPRKCPKKNTKVYLSQARMLKICKIRSLINDQKKLGVTLISKIIQHKTPQEDYDILKNCMFYPNGGKYIDPFVKTSSTKTNVTSSKLNSFNPYKGKFRTNYILKRDLGMFDIKFKMPNFMKKKSKQIQKITFPYNYFDILNKLPSNIRANIGFKSNPFLIKNYFDKLCQHRERFADDLWCKDCSFLNFKNSSLLKTLNSDLHKSKVLDHKKFIPICPLQIINPKLNQIMAEMAVHTESTINMIIKKQKFSCYENKIERMFSDYSTLESKVANPDGSESRNHITIEDELIFLESHRLVYNAQIIDQNKINFWHKRSTSDILENFTGNATNHFGEVFENKRFRYLHNKKSSIKV